MDKTYQDILEQAGIGVLTCSREGIVEYINKTAFDILELKIDFSVPKDVLGKNISVLFFEEDPAGTSAIQAQSATRKITTLAGTTKHIRFQAVEQHISGADLFRITLTDESRQTAQLEELLEMAATHETFIDKCPFPAVIFQNKELVFANPAAFDFFSVSQDRSTKKTIESLFSEIDKERIFRHAAKKDRCVPEDYHSTVNTSAGRVPVEIFISRISYKAKPAAQVVLRSLHQQSMPESDNTQSTLLLQNIFASIRDGIFIISNDRIIVSTNPMLEKWYSHKAPLVGKKCQEILFDNNPPQDYCENCTQRHGAQGQSQVVNAAPEGEDKRWIEFHSYPLVDQSTGQIKGIIGYGRDITKRVNALTDLRKSQEMLRMVMDTIPQCIFWKDINCVYLGCNANFAAIAGFESPEQIIGKRDEELSWTDKQIKDIRARDLLVIESNKAQMGIIKERRLANDKTAWMEINTIPMHDEDGKVIGVLGTKEDITSKKMTEEQIHKLYRAVEQSLHTIIITDADGRVEYVNPRYTQITGFEHDEVLKEHIQKISFATMDETEFAGVWESIKEGTEWQGKVLNRKKDGSTYWENVMLAPIRNQNDEITHFLGVIEDITERIKAEEKIIHMAYYDPLTNLPNRALFNDRIALALAHAQRNRQMLAVMFVDLDRFRNINDTLGHDIGDRLVRGVTERLKYCLRDADTVARMGGDEFMLLLPGIENLQDVAKIANKISVELQPPFIFDSHELHITASIGISLYPYDGEDPQTLLKNADTALNRAKEYGRNNYQLYTSGMNAKAMERLQLENSLRKALENEELLVYYQPQVDMHTYRIIGMEVLLRWQHPQNGLVFPDQFIALAEETGLIIPMGEWVLKNACLHNKNWFSKNRTVPLTLAVNISTRQFQQHKLMKTILGVLQETGFDPKYLELEITESILMQKDTVPMAILRELKGMGIKLSVDDFGTGYSSLSYLKRFPIDTIKIDRSFVRDCISNPDDAAIVQAIVSMAQSLNLKVIAEGVETREQLEFLRGLKCDALQGYLFSRPLPPAEFAELLDKGFPFMEEEQQA